MHEHLSDEGRDRAEAMLGELRGVVRARRRRRVAARASLAIVVLAAGVGLLTTMQRPAPVTGVVATSAPPEGDAGPSFEIVRTSGAGRYTTIDDDTLLELLQEAGYEGGLVRRGESVELTAPLPEPPSGPPSGPSPRDTGV
ncbi:MAG: hypothetical protein AAFR38_09760 [Planctomycetota bacterium]